MGNCNAELCTRAAQKLLFTPPPVSFPTSLAFSVSIRSEFSLCPSDRAHSDPRTPIIMTLFSACTVLPWGPWVMTLLVPLLCSKCPLTLQLRPWGTVTSPPMICDQNPVTTNFSATMYSGWKDNLGLEKSNEKSKPFLFVHHSICLSLSFDKCETFWKCHDFSFTKEKTFMAGLGLGEEVLCWVLLSYEITAAWDWTLNLAGSAPCTPQLSGRSWGGIPTHANRISNKWE